MKHRSFTSFLNSFLQERGFVRKGRSYWYRDLSKALIIISLQQSTFGRGLYINFGLCLGRSATRRLPKEYECPVFGRNPGLSARDFGRFQALLDLGPAVLCQPDSMETITAGLEANIRTLIQWQDISVLRERVRSRRTLEMVVDRPALGLQP